MFDLITSDLNRKRTHYVRINNFVNKYLKITFQLGTIAVVIYRFGCWVEKLPVLFRYTLLIGYKILDLISGALTGVYVSRKVQIGKGFVIHNFANVIVNAVEIGDNFTVNQGVSIGCDWQSKVLPVIGNNVFVGAGAKILGDVNVGNNVIVAANALVIKDIPDNCTVVGIPAMIVSRDSDSQYLDLTD